MLAEGRRYVSDGAFRRASLEASLANPRNTYSRQRLASYALGDRGWDALPEWNPLSAPVTADVARAAQAREAIALPEGTRPLWDGRTPETLDAWVALGREVFFGYPLRAEPLAEFALARPEFAATVGVRADASGAYPGLRAIVDVDGRTRIAITCALCHTNVEDGRVVAGRARRDFDYGRLRLAYHRETGAAVDPALAARMAHWGPGRADVTEDDDEDPVAIPDLWGLRAQSALTQAGTIRHVGPVALAIRQETQLLHSNHQRVRPPRVLAYALAMYLYALEPPPAARARPPAAPADVVARGAGIFAEQCASCHANAAGGGDPVSASRVGTDPSLADGHARGTGRYRPPALVRVGDAAPYLHHGAVATLEDLFSPARLAPSYRGGALGPGPVPGHAYGLSLDDRDRAALIAYLRSL